MSVCKDDTEDSCVECGTVATAVPEKNWVDVKCRNDGIDGKFVKIAATNNYLQVAEVEVSGVGELMLLFTRKKNKTGTSKVGAISKAQKAQKTFF